MDKPAKLSWYFDLIPPFSYLHLKQFDRLPAGLEIEYVPALFWGQDSLEMMLDCLRDPGLLDTPEMRRASSLLVGTACHEASKP